MASPPPPIPPGFHTLTPYLIIRDAAEAIDFYYEAFGAEERFRIPGPDGTSIGHAELTIGDSIVMLASASPDAGNHAPPDLGGSPVHFVLYVEDADAAFRRAVDAGATVRHAMEDKFYGDRAGTVEDPYGFHWTVMTHVEDVSPEEMNRRLEAEYAKR